MTFVGRSLVDSFTNSLQGMANSMRCEADFWEHQGNTIRDWQSTRQLYLSADDAMPTFPPVLDDACSGDPSPIEVGQNFTALCLCRRLIIL